MICNRESKRAMKVYDMPEDWIAARAKKHSMALYRALRDLLEDSQHSDHNCGDEGCCVARARIVLAEINGLSPQQSPDEKP